MFFLIVYQKQNDKSINSLLKRFERSQAKLYGSHRTRKLRGGSLKDEQSATHQAATLAPQRSITCVTVPTSLPSWIIGLPDTSVVNKGQQLLTKIHKNTPRYYVSACFIFLIVYKLVCNFHSFIRVICPCNFHTNIFKCFLLLSHTPRCLHHVFI